MKETDEEIIEVNDDNYKAYCELLCAKLGVTYNDKNKWMNISQLAGVVTCLTALIVGIGIPIALSLNLILSFLVALPIVSLGAFGTVKVVEKLDEALVKHDIKKNFPDLNFNVDEYSLDSALKRYEELSIVPENIEELKKKHENIFSKDTNEMTTQEKIEYLNKEKEFWEAYAIKEKYEKEDNKVKNKSDDIMRMKN